MRVALDTGALIALERNDRRLWTLFARAASARDDLVVPSAVVAQVWRGTSRQAALARALSSVIVAPFDPIARRIGELCGRAGTSDVCDAQLAIVAAECDLVFTSDPRDIDHLLGFVKRGRPKILRC